MAVIDTFLKLMVTQKAERLVLVPEEVPTLRKSDETIPLPMPAVPADLAKRLALEVVGAEQSEALAGGQPVEGAYRSDDGDEFAFVVTTNGAGCRIEMYALDEGADSEGADPKKPEAREEEAVPNRDAPEVAPAQRTLEPRKSDLPAPQPDPAVLAALEESLRADASDLFLSTGKPAQMRIDGVIRGLDTALATDVQILQLLPNEEGRRELERSGSVDFGAAWEIAGTSRRFRINVFRHSRGLAAAFRPIRALIPSLPELHLPGDLLELCSHSSGLVLVTGASGSGKSTTLAALVDHINQTMARHIITIEDPIEFEHRDDNSLVHQREVGTDLESFSAGLRAALRENPDVILLGEMRDLDTISAALTAAETGHLVLSTLHTGNATAAVNRIVDVFPGHQQAHVRVQLAASLRAVVAQRLVPAADHSGRLPVLEKLIVTPAVANGIRDGHEHHMRSAMQTGAEEGMITLERSLASLVRNGQISRDTAYRYADDQQALHKLLD